MNSRNSLFPAALLVLAAIASVLMLMSPAVVQGNNGVSSLGTPDDWTHHYLVFSHPGSFADAVRHDSFESWYRVVTDPRYIMQLRTRGVASSGTITASGFVAPPFPVRRHRSTLHRDWGMSLQAAGSVPNAMYPAKGTFDVNATPDCKNDYAAFTTGHTGSATAPSIIAFDELYSTQGGNCLGSATNGTGPQVKWAYYMNTGAGAVVTSPVLSVDGTKIAYVESSAGNHASLRLLKWKPGTGANVEGTLAAPALPDTILAAGTAWNTTNCPAANSCIGSLTLNGNPQDTTSPPFYNYATDNLYVGDSAGVLHKFTGVFNGSPSEVTAGWPITVHAGNALTGPVFDSGSGNIFVGDASGQLRYVRESGSTEGMCASGSPPCLGSTNQTLGGSIVDPPIVDSANGTVFVFDGQTGTNNTAEVRHTNTALTTVATVSFANNGSAAGVANMHAGTFDNTYYSGAAGSGVGKLYVCAQGTTARDHATLFRIGFTAGTGANLGISVMNTAADTGSLGLVNGNGEDCSPITEISNTAASTEWIFWSVGNHSSVPTGSACATGAAGCLLALNLTTLGATWPPVATGSYFLSFRTPAGPTYSSLGGGAIHAAGTSGIVVDNVASTVTSPQASSVYFSLTSNSTAAVPCDITAGVGCAIKLTQSGLN